MRGTVGMTYQIAKAVLIHIHMHVLEWGDDCDLGHRVDVDVVGLRLGFAEEAKERLEGERETLHGLLHLALGPTISWWP